MYLSNFEARAFFDRKPEWKVSLCVRTLMYRRSSTEISSHVHSFQDEEEATNDAVFFFKAEKSRRKTDDSNFRIRANKYYLLFQF